MIRAVVIWMFVLRCQLPFAQQSPVSIQVDVSKPAGEMRPFWAHFGYDEPNYTTRENGWKLLTELQQLSPVPVYVRTHNLLTSKGNSVGPDLKWGYTDAYKEDPNGNPIYNWTIVDSIIDAYIQRGMKPLMEIGFMPKALSSNPEPYEHNWSASGNLWTGWAYPPKDYNKWRELVYQWVKHSIERYGKEEVTTWLWELWNEPDIGYWSGTLMSTASCMIILPIKNYATGKTGTPLQYIGFHAKGSPEFINGHICMIMGVQLKGI